VSPKIIVYAVLSCAGGCMLGYLLMCIYPWRFLMGYVFQELLNMGSALAVWSVYLGSWSLLGLACYIVLIMVRK